MKYLMHTNSKIMKKVEIYGDYVLECIVKQINAKPIENFNMRNRKR